MHASEGVTRVLVLVLLHKELAVLGVLVLEVQYVEGGTALVGPATLRLQLLDLDLVLVPCSFLVHELPAFHVPVVLLHSIKRWLYLKH